MSTIMMAVGLPNVGKSSVINALRKNAKIPTAVAKVEAKPGLTRHVSAFLVSESPRIFLIDSPGVMIPKVLDDSHVLKLALVGIIPDAIVGIESVAQFALEQLNSHNALAYIRELSLPGPVTDLEQLLEASNATETTRQSVITAFVQSFRQGKFGKFVLDDLTKYRQGPVVG
eukprot:c8935_g1_i1.p1 GENE.c8935_g1_i1~~c8935_g1_i1.p1  ORF type:complete len:172 (+),score=33.76 c8935_g1_i1:451-966(+)